MAVTLTYDNLRIQLPRRESFQNGAWTGGHKMFVHYFAANTSLSWWR
jgi:hypothetical protein